MHKLSQETITPFCKEKLFQSCNNGTQTCREKLNSAHLECESRTN